MERERGGKGDRRGYAGRERAEAWKRWMNRSSSALVPAAVQPRRQPQTQWIAPSRDATAADTIRSRRLLRPVDSSSASTSTSGDHTHSALQFTIRLPHSRHRRSHDTSTRSSQTALTARYPRPSIIRLLSFALTDPRSTVSLLDGVAMESYSVPSSPFDHYAVGDTDSSADSTYNRSSHSAQSSPYTSGRMLDTTHIMTPHTSTNLPHPSPTSSHSLLSLPSTATTSSSLSSSPSSLPPSHSSSTSSLSTSPSTAPRDRPVRTKDRLKHSESENRRRTRLRHKFSLLRDASGCVKKDRYTILTTAVGKIGELQARMQQAEQEKAALLININNITSQQQRQQQHQQHQQQQQVQAMHKGEVQSSAVAASAPLSALSSLSFYPLLSTVCCAFISLDGRLLDTNAELCHRLRYQREELIHSSLFALCDPAHLVDTVCVLKRLLDGDSHTWEMHRWCVTKDGGRVRMHVTLAPVHHEGRLVFFLMLMVPAVQEEGGGQGQGRSRGGEKEAGGGFAMDPVYASMASSSHPHPPPLEPKHELDSAMPYSNAFPSPPAAYAGGTSALQQEEVMGMLQPSPPPSSSPTNLRFLHSSSPIPQSLAHSSLFPPLPVEHLQQSIGSTPHHPSLEPVIALKQEYNAQQAERSSHMQSSSLSSSSSSPSSLSSSYPNPASHYSRAPSMPPYPTLQSHERPPPISDPSASPARRLPPSSISTAAFPRHPGLGMGVIGGSGQHSQTGGGMGEGRGAVGGWGRPSMSAPNSPAVQKGRMAGSGGGMGGLGGGGGAADQSLDWLYAQGTSAGTDGSVSRQRPPLVDMRC